MEDLVRYEDDCSEFTLNFCSDQHRKNQEELLLCKILLCMQGGEKWAYGRERDFDDFLDDMFGEGARVPYSLLFLLYLSFCIGCIDLSKMTYHLWGVILKQQMIRVLEE